MRLVISNHTARTCDAENGSAVIRAIKQAQRTDPLQYMKGLKKIRLVPDRDDWNAKYDADDDEVLLEGKFLDKPLNDMVQVLLHEAGHRGQSKDSKTYEAFKRRGLNLLSFFLAMANKAHREDYARKGEIPNIAEEVFAESYSRFALKLDMPETLRKFWQERIQ